MTVRIVSFDYELSQNMYSNWINLYRRGRYYDDDGGDYHSRKLFIHSFRSLGNLLGYLITAIGESFIAFFIIIINFCVLAVKRLKVIMCAF